MMDFIVVNIFCLDSWKEVITTTTTTDDDDDGKLDE
jgi:hypothetical protein